MVTALNILKLLGLVLTGAFGILGLLTEFRDDKTKKITKWGKVALFGIFLSTALSFVSQVLEARKSAKQAQDQLARSNEILNNLNRSLNPLTNVRVTYWIKVPLDAPELQAFRERLTAGIAALMVDGQLKANGAVAYAATSEPNGHPLKIGIPSYSPLMPQPNEVIAFYLLRHSGLEFSFFKKPYADADFLADDFSKRPRPDLSFRVMTTENQERQGYSMDYDLQSHELIIYATDLFSDPQYWQSNNQIQAVPDLANVQMAIKIDDTMVPRLTATGERDEDGKTLSRLRSQIELQSLIIKINTRELWIKRNEKGNIHRLNGETKPRSTYLTVFPKSVDDLQLR
jgi:hypothetical protein